MAPLVPFMPSVEVAEAASDEALSVGALEIKPSESDGYESDGIAIEVGGVVIEPDVVPECIMVEELLELNRRIDKNFFSIGRTSLSDLRRIGSGIC